MKTKKKEKSKGDKLTIAIDQSKTGLSLARWSSSGPPKAEYVDRLTFTRDDAKIKCVDSHSNVNYLCEEDLDNNCNYFVGIRVGQRLVVKPVKTFNVKPAINYQTNVNSSVPDLTNKEKLEELNDKFGSKRSKRMLENTRKFRVELGEDDTEALKSNVQMVEAADSVKKKRSATVVPLEDDSHSVVPKQNLAATSIKEVYDIKEIIGQKILTKIEADFADVDLKLALPNEAISKLVKTPEDKFVAVYLSIIVATYQLKYNNLKKVDPLEEFQHIPMDIRNYVLEKYCVACKVNKLDRLSLPDHRRDKLLADAIVILMYLHNYVAVELEQITSLLKCPITKMRKIAVAVGCYIVKRKNKQSINAEYLVLRIPLNKLQAPRAKKLKI
ncbi:hypothetical protein HDE_14380 [Halotydeus destructor]|nr:hypothetical protein HDE_14380 [Halotydeus destructor]